MHTRTHNKMIKNHTVKWFVLVGLVIGLLSNCSKDNTSDEGGYATAYSGTGNFNFTGDFNLTYSGQADNIKITSVEGLESLPITFIDNLGKEIFIGLRSTTLEIRTYTMKELNSEGYAATILEGELYDSGALGGMGTVSLNILNRNKIKGTVDMRLARPLNTADTVIVKGTFELNAL